MTPDDDELDRTVRALADVHRRTLLDGLRARDGQTVSELENLLPELGRHAVLKHLRVLEHAALVTTHKNGRSRIVRLNPTPIVGLATRWLDDYAALAGLTLNRLRRHLEAGRDQPGASIGRGATMPTTANRTTEPRTLVATIVIEAAPERVWAAITDPEETRHWFFGGVVRSDWQVGSAIEWVDAKGGSLIAGDITAIDPKVRLAHTFSATWSEATAADPASDYEWLLEPLGESMTRVTVTHANVPAGTPTAEQVDGGNSLVISALKTYVEIGRTMPGMG